MASHRLSKGKSKACPTAGPGIFRRCHLHGSDLGVFLGRNRPSHVLAVCRTKGFTPLIQPNFLSDTRCGFWLVYVPNDDIRSYEPFGASSDSFSHNGGTSDIPVFSCSPCARALSARMSRAHHRRGERRAAHGIRSAHGCGRSQPLWASLPPLPRRWRPRQVAANLAAAAVWVLMMRSRLARARRGR